MSAAAPDTCPAYQNPVLDLNFPDPGVLRHGGQYYAFATNDAASNVQVAVSEDLVRMRELQNSSRHA